MTSFDPIPGQNGSSRNSSRLLNISQPELNRTWFFFAGYRPLLVKYVMLKVDAAANRIPSPAIGGCHDANV